MAHGIYTSSVLFFIPYGAFYSVAGEDGQHIADYQSFAVTMATSLVIVVSVQVTLLVKTSLLNGFTTFKMISLLTDFVYLVGGKNPKGILEFSYQLQVLRQMFYEPILVIISEYM